MTQEEQSLRAKETEACVEAIRSGTFVFPHLRVGQLISNAVTTFRLNHPEQWNTDDTYHMPNDLLALAVREYTENFGKATS